jgi:hypothetical protein
VRGRKLRSLNRMRADVLYSLVEDIDLEGLEYRSRSGKLIGIIQTVADWDHPGCPEHAWVCHTGGGMSMQDFHQRLISGHYVCLPGSGESGDSAMAEAFRARVLASG